MKFWVLGVVAVVALVGCTPTEVTSDSAKQITKDFTPSKFDEEMKKQGKGAELEEAKKREEAYKNAGKPPESGTTSVTPNDPNVNP